MTDERYSHFASTHEQIKFYLDNPGHLTDEELREMGFVPWKTEWPKPTGPESQPRIYDSTQAEGVQRPPEFREGIDVWYRHPNDEGI